VKHRKILTPILIFLILICRTSPIFAGEPSTGPASNANEAKKTIHIVLLHVNDVHGKLEGYTGPGTPVGGYARLATAVDQQRKSPADRLFLIHAGDEFSRGDTLTRATLGRANIAIMNKVGFDFWVPGNGDYYDGLDNLQKRIAEANFNVLTANIIVKTTGRPVAKPYLIQQIGNVKIAFLGLGYIHTEHPSSAPLVLADAVATAKVFLPEIRKKADIVVAVTHIGFDEDKKLAAAVDGLDVIIGAHSHSLLFAGWPIKSPSGNKVLICQAADLLRYLGRVDLTVENKNGNWTLTRKTARLIPLDAKIKLDPAITALIARLNAQIPQSKNVVAPQPVSP